MKVRFASFLTATANYNNNILRDTIQYSQITTRHQTNNHVHALHSNVDLKRELNPRPLTHTEKYYTN